MAVEDGSVIRNPIVTVTMDMMLLNQPPASATLSSLSWPVSSSMPSTRPVLTATASKTPNTVAPMMTTAEDILELEAGLTQIEEPQTIMELVVEVTMEDPRTLVVEDREVLELVALEEELVVFGQELLQVASLVTCLETEETQDTETMEDTTEAGDGVVEDTTEDLQGVPLLLVVEEGLPRHLVPGQLLDLVERGGDKY